MFHPDKCVSIEIGKKSEPNYKYELDAGGDRHKLKWIQSEKDIGVQIDADLKFAIHISSKVNKANGIIGLIRRSYKFLTEEIFMHLYKGLVRCHFDYAASVSNPYRKSHINLIETVQRRATKLVPTLKDLPYHDRLKKLKLPTC